MSNEEIEKLELKYLEKINSLMVVHQDNILRNLLSMNTIYDYWEGKSDDEGFDRGAERVLYSVLQRGSDLGEPNSAPVGSDLFFENSEAYIHIDLKTSQPDTNLRDHWETPVGKNQNSYKSSQMPVRDSRGTVIERREYEPSLPKFYGDKPTLTYFITILYLVKNRQFFVLNINVASMPNGQLEEVYGGDPLAPGKNIGTARFAMNKCCKFRNIDNGLKKRIIINYENLRELERRKATMLEENFLSLIRSS